VLCEKDRKMDTPIATLAFIYSTLELDGADDVSDMESVALRDVRTSRASHHKPQANYDASW
jgi:hypothetical protein